MYESNRAEARRASTIPDEGDRQGNKHQTYMASKLALHVQYCWHRYVQAIGERKWTALAWNMIEDLS